MPKYYDFMTCGYYLYFTSHCYQEMFLKWSEMSNNGFYRGE